MAGNLANMLLGGHGPVAANPIYMGNQSQIMNPQQMHLMNVQSAQIQNQGGQFGNNQQRIAAAGQAAQAEEAKRTMTDILMNLSGQKAGRGMPAYNKHEQEGRTGLVDPGLTDQQTALPIPFDRQWDLASNLQAYISSLPAETFNMNEQVRQLVDQTVPQAQRSLVAPSSIYEKVSPNPMVNRLNLALQRKREQSLYAVI